MPLLQLERYPPHTAVRAASVSIADPRNNYDGEIVTSRRRVSTAPAGLRRDQQHMDEIVLLRLIRSPFPMWNPQHAYRTCALQRNLCSSLEMRLTVSRLIPSIASPHNVGNETKYNRGFIFNS